MVQPNNRYFLVILDSLKPEYSEQRARVYPPFLNSTRPWGPTGNRPNDPF